MFYYGYVAIQAYGAYKDEWFLQWAKDLWSAVYISPENIQATGKNFTSSGKYY